MSVVIKLMNKTFAAWRLVQKRLIEYNEIIIPIIVHVDINKRLNPSYAFFI